MFCASFESLVTGGGGEASFVISRWVFLRLLGIICLIAFSSFWCQAEGLIGRNGILPLDGYLRAVKAQTGPERYGRWPTVFWLNSGDAALHTVCALGVLASLLLIAGAAPLPSLAVIWLLYLSITVAGQTFMSFQWDVLLIETCFLAMFVAPGGLRPGLSGATAVTLPACLLLWWLLFRLMFESGVVKLTSGDVTWKNLTALDYHYFTQPLPAWPGWYAHWMPSWFHRISTVMTYGIEILLPFLIFSGRSGRIAACAGIILLQVMILVTGNYNFFNLLTIALALFLLDDGVWLHVIPSRLLDWIGYTSGTPAPVSIGRGILTLAVVIFFMTVGLIQVFQALHPRSGVLANAELRLNCLGRWQSLNSYGLFRVMTTQRPEIEIESSLDGQNWKACVFKYKPGDLKQKPRFVEPHQPRLDWQMWFAALGMYETEPWFRNFLIRLLTAQPEVLTLLDGNPFPDAAPRYIRARLYDYEFASPAERRQTGNWWKRTLLGNYSPTFERTSDGRILIH
jgi:hypothetical protein